MEPLLSVLNVDPSILKDCCKHSNYIVTIKVVVHYVCPKIYQNYNTIVVLKGYTQYYTKLSENLTV